MFYYLEGLISHIGPYLAVVDCAGVGYACKATSYTLGALSVGKKGKLYTYLNVREDTFELYGFATENERNCFEMLIGVSGVGPKAALSILSSNSPENLVMAIVTENEKALTGVPGIGKKTAQRIILELKDKLKKEQLIAEPAGEQYGGSGVTLIPENKGSEATAALAVLGYCQTEIAAALKGLDMTGMSVEEIIKAALRAMMKQ